MGFLRLAGRKKYIPPFFCFFFIHSPFSEARGIGERDGLPAGDHRRGRGGLRLAHHPRRHRRPQAEEVPEEV